MRTETMITEAWTAGHDDPLVLKSGERVVVGRRSDEWPGFVWCESSTGKEGWVPEKLLSYVDGAQAVAIEGYDTRELTVRVGDRVLTSESLADWTWCERPEGPAGWVPNRCLGDSR